MQFERPALYVVGTPIGNLEDISERMRQTLSEVDFIAAEDTRVSQKLLNHMGIKKSMVSYYEHNRISSGQEIVRRLQSGENCALISDAGMPAISDPGEMLVADCAAQGIPVYVVPGPTAFVSALAVSGLPTGRFCFEGFLTVNKKNRRDHLDSIKDENRTLIFYEAPHKLRRTLSDLYSTLGNRRISIVRELTKLHEEVIRTDLEQASKLYKNQEPRGEFVLVVEGAEDKPVTKISIEQAVEKAAEYVKAGMQASEAARCAAKESGLGKSEIYRRMTKKTTHMED